ncbi:TetR/AcrR family transcriptional regulator [Paraburkholderia sp. D15]|uniref:TetR/AcrR family transcriptional regulator n=1 Tax=Paraburkholderia sp. D15 TaxID=2880218 RepID=UPI0024783D70|nr:TetR/AcrR family transcriptional regulator [Paraburkholderia sp. D15]WGS50464.1 TetR/AcrR family transcriptional regulator [Paraburkholderia sp. D15]
MKHFSELTSSATRIVDAAEGLIQHLGYNGFSYEDIAVQVGIRKPSVHHHFATKAELGAVVVQRYTHRFREALLRIEGTVIHAPNQLRAYVDLFAKTYAQDGRLCVCGILGAESESLPEEIRGEIHRFFEINIVWLSAVIEKGLSAGTLKSSRSASELAGALLALLEGSMLVGRGLKGGFDLRAAADVLISSMT